MSPHIIKLHRGTLLSWYLSGTYHITNRIPPITPGFVINLINSTKPLLSAVTWNTSSITLYGYGKCRKGPHADDSTLKTVRVRHAYYPTTTVSHIL